MQQTFDPNAKLWINQQIEQHLIQTGMMFTTFGEVKGVIQDIADDIGYQIDVSEYYDDERMTFAP